MTQRSAAWLFPLLASAVVFGCARGGAEIYNAADPDFQPDASGDGPSWELPDASLDDDAGDGGGGSTCTPKTCESYGAECGYVADGCGDVVFCGGCADGETCGGSGIANKCGGPCKALTCADLGVGCGIHGDGCGGTLDCGGCQDGEFCGGGGPNNCGPLPPTVVCKTKEEACDQAGLNCGWVSDGCGGVIDCGECKGGQTCGGGGVPGKCGGGSCEPKTCADYGYECGKAADGCGGLLDCGTCPAPTYCGGGGPGKCGGVR